MVARGEIPQRTAFSLRHVIWRYSVGVGSSIGSSKLGLTSEWAGYFIVDLLSACYAMLMSYNNNEIAVHGYNSALFWVLTVSRWCLAKLIFTQYDQHCSILFAEFNLSRAENFHPYTVKPLLSGPPIKLTPSINRTLSRVPKLIPDWIDNSSIGLLFLEIRTADTSIRRTRALK